jgi:hypothetical protein
MSGAQYGSGSGQAAGGASGSNNAGDDKADENFEKLREVLKEEAKTDQDKEDADRLIDNLKRARKRIMDKGGPVRWRFPGCSGLVCNEVQDEVQNHLPLIGTGIYEYRGKTKVCGPDHSWGQIVVDDKPIATIDFWQDPVDFWRKGGGSPFGWTADEDVPVDPDDHGFGVWSGTVH